MANEDPRGLIPYIREAARRNGIDPDVAVRVAKSEGLATFHSMVTDKQGQREPSFGAFQLYTGGGLGNTFQKQTGLDPSDPANEKATIDFAMQQAAKTGWGPWHGAQRVGIANNAGIPGGVTLNSTPAAPAAVADKPQTMVDKVADSAGDLAGIGTALQPKPQAQSAPAIQPSNLANDPIQFQQAQQAQQLMATLLADRRKKMGMGMSLMG